MDKKPNHGSNIQKHNIRLAHRKSRTESSWWSHAKIQHTEFDIRKFTNVSIAKTVNITVEKLFQISESNECLIQSMLHLCYQPRAPWSGKIWGINEHEMATDWTLSMWASQMLTPLYVQLSSCPKHNMQVPFLRSFWFHVQIRD